MNSSSVLQEGELCLFVDRKKRSNLIRLESGTLHHTHTGTIDLDTVIGQPEGVEVETTGGARYFVMRPTLTDFTLKMPRGAQVIYPKDLGPILVQADLAPGMRVLETGVGSGALSLAMLRCGVEIVGYEIREDFAEVARENVATFSPEAVSRYNVKIANSYEGIMETELDRVVLDIPEPWQVVPHAAGALRSGGVLVSYSPSILQVTRTHEALRAAGFQRCQTVEVLERSWYVEGQAVRPDHRMVAHTGFLTSARWFSARN